MIDSAVILATGNPYHTSQLTQDRPRAMLPALGKPMVVRVMEQLYRANIRHFVVVVGLNEGAVASYLDKQWVPDAQVELVLQDTRHSLPTVLVNTAKKLQSPFIITSYNSFTYERFVNTLIRRHEAHPDALFLTGARSTLSKASHLAYALMEEERVVAIAEEVNEQKHYIVADLAVCGQHFVDYLTSAPTFSKNISEFTDIVQDYLSSKAPQAMISETSWILQVETDNDLLSLNKYLLDDINDAHILSELPYTVKIIPPIRIDPQVSVGQGAVIGPHVYLERGSSVGYGATVSNAIVLERGSVQANAKIDQAIIARNGRVIE